MKKFTMIAAGAATLLAFSGAASASESFYKSGTAPTCASCHDRGIAGAPKLNTPEDWQGIELDAEVLVESTMSGKGAMPSYQGRADRAEVKTAVEYMISTVR